MKKRKISKHLHSPHGQKVIGKVLGTRKQRYGIRVTKDLIGAMSMFWDSICTPLWEGALTEILDLEPIDKVLLPPINTVTDELKDLTDKEANELRALVSKTLGVPEQFLYGEEECRSGIERSLQER